MITHYRNISKLQENRIKKQNRYPNTHMHNRSVSWLEIDILIVFLNDEITLVLWIQMH